MKLKQSQVLLTIAITTLLLMSCQFASFTLGNVLPKPTAEPSPTQPLLSATAIAVPSLVLSTQEQHETSDSPEYKIDARWPKLEWGNDPRTTGFNQAVEAYIQQTLQTFKEDVAHLDPSIPSETSSYIEIDYEVNNATADLLSVEMKITAYEAGAMHPGHTLYGINYDLHEGKLLTLADLFQPDAKYLETISAFCIDSLSSRNILSWEEGALPTAENYQVWNLAPEGLIIFFNEYQIAPYAAGPQSVLVPYEHLNSILRSGGPLDGLLKK